MTVCSMKCRLPLDDDAAGLAGGEVHWTGGTETGVDPTRGVTIATQIHIADDIAPLQAMWAEPVVAASLQKTD